MTFSILELIAALQSLATDSDEPLAWVRLLFSAMILAGLGGILHKAGRPAIACVIPVFAELMLLDTIHRPRWWAALLLLPVLDVAAGVFGLPTTGLGATTSIVSYIASCIVFVLLVERFGKGTLHYLGVVLFPFVFLPELGFGSAEYHPPFASRRRREN